YKFTTPWKRYVMIAICFLPVWKTFKVTTKAWTYYKGYVRNEEKQRLYNVAIFQQGNDTIPPLTTGTLRWKYVCFLDYATANQKIVIFDMQENQIMHQCKWDSLHKKITFAGEDSVHFSSTSLSDGNLQLNGY
ncbi:MAG TPA: hypothetical protein VKB95_00590, partial [Chitinophagaceae bacterium]|nr:hypothetical protein [Chitinophagaceae bacterium]